MEAIRGISRRARWVKVAVGIATSVTLGAFFAQTAGAINIDTSPYRGDVLQTRLSDPLYEGAQSNMVYHILKDHPSSTVRGIELEAYYDQALRSHYIEIDDKVAAPPGSTNRCSPIGTANPFIIVTLRVDAPSAPAADREIRYQIPYNRVCTVPAAGTSNPRNLPGRNNSYFFARYPVPLAFNAGQAARDPETGLYRVYVRIEYGTGVALNVSPVQQVLFKAKTNPCSGVGCQRYIGATPVTPFSPRALRDRNIATLGPTNDGDPSGYGVYTQQRFTFGLPCSATGAQRRTVTVFDIDNDDTGGAWADGVGGTAAARARFYIERSSGGSPWTALGRDDYLSYIDEYVESGVAGSAQSNRESYGGVWTIRPRNGSSVTTQVEFNMQPRTRYRVVVTPLWSNNMLGIGLPGKSIFGAIDCNVGVEGSITTNPSTGVSPIEAGRVFDIAASAMRTGNTAFDSLYFSDFKVWYDTGNNVFDPATESPIRCTATGNRTHRGTGVLALGNCPGVVADPSRSGGRASAVCAQLILTRNAADTLTQIGTGAAPAGLTRCFQIGKYPHLEARNGDVFAGGRLASFNPTCTIATIPVIASSQRQIRTGGPFYTSYATYGVTSLGSSTTFGSMGLSYDAAPATTADDLVFANTSTLDGFFRNPTGNNGVPAPHCLNDPFAIFGPRASAGTDVPGSVIDISTQTANNINLTDSGTIVLHASQPIQPGKKIVIYAKQASIEIASNIVYADQAYGSINEIPQVVILSEYSTVVREAVTQLDGIYGTRLNFYTCNRIPRLHICELPLKINGAVVVGNNTIPLRVAGAELPNLGAMAETFNLRSDMFLNQLPEAGGPDVFIKTLSETEIPPRF